MAFCPNCGSQMPAGAAACPSCAGGAPAAVTAAPAGGLTDNIAGALAYVTFIPAIVFLVLEPYSKNRFIRFHSFQCLFLCGALFALGIVLSIISMVPFLGLVTIPLGFALWVGTIVVAVILIVKAYQGQKFKLPIVGDMAEKQANTV